MTLNLFEALRVGSGPLWLKAQSHPFVDALGDGSLPRDKFIHFLKQDYVFLIAYCRAIAFGVARSPQLPLMQQFVDLLHDTVNSEMQLHRDYCASFGINAAELSATRPSPTCQAYCDFCIAAAAGGGLLELLCALAPCAVGYFEIGHRLAAAVAEDKASWPGGLDAHPYGQWIATYSGAEFGAYAKWTADVLSELGVLNGLPSSTGTPLMAELQRHFDLGCRYEWLFWEMAWTRQDWPL